MKIRLLNKKTVLADARPYGTKKFPNTREGKRDARRWLESTKREIYETGDFLDPKHSPLVAVAAGLNEKDPNYSTSFLNAQWARTKYKDPSDRICVKHINNMITDIRTFCNLSYRGKKLGECRLADLRQNDLKSECVPQLLSNLALKTARNKHNTFKMFLEFCVEKNWINSNPGLFKLPKMKIKQMTSRDLITKATVQKIIDTHSNDRPWASLYIESASRSGMRAGEQIALEWSDLKDGRFDINKSWVDGVISPPKTANGYRSISLGNDLLLKLKQWKAWQPEEMKRNNLIFPNAQGGYNTPDHFRCTLLHKACERAGVPKFRWHDLRHFYASILIYHAELNAETIARLMGHTDSAFTQKKYGVWIEDAERDKKIDTKLDLAFAV